jgi:hypothetical protein
MSNINSDWQSWFARNFGSLFVFFAQKITGQPVCKNEVSVHYFCLAFFARQFALRIKM